MPAITGCTGSVCTSRIEPPVKNSCRFVPATTFFTGRWSCVDGEEAAAIEAHERAAAAHERVDRAHAVGADAAGELRRHHAGRVAVHQPARFVGDDEHVDAVGQRRRRRGSRHGVEVDVLEAVLLEHPARPAFVHAGLPRPVEADARLLHLDAGGAGGALGLQRQRGHEVGDRRVVQPAEGVARALRAGRRHVPHGAARLPRAVDGAEARCSAPDRRAARRRCRWPCRPAARWRPPSDSTRSPCRAGCRTAALSAVPLSYGDGRRGERRRAAQRPQRGPRVGRERRRRRRHLHAHLIRQRPAGRVVGLLERTIRRLAQLRILLHLEHLARGLGELLIHRDHPGARRRRSRRRWSRPR